MVPEPGRLLSLKTTFKGKQPVVSEAVKDAVGNS